MELEDLIINDLRIPKSLIREALTNSRRQVKIFTIPKRDGGKRTIHHPSRRLKTIQYWLIHNIFDHISVSEHAAAYREGQSIIDNAKKHLGNYQFIKTDLENFFPSITYNDLRPYLADWHKQANPAWHLNSKAENLINQVCFYKNDSLVIGYPCSPVISNIVMRDFDQRLFSKLKSVGAKDTKYTRYADDIIISSKSKSKSKELFNILSKEISNCASPNIKINQRKTRFGSSLSGTAFVTGLKITHDKRIIVRKDYKDQLRLLLSLANKGKLSSADFQKTLGHLNYVRHVDPALFNKLTTKHFQVIESIKSSIAAKKNLASLSSAINSAISTPQTGAKTNP